MLAMRQALNGGRRCWELVAANGLKIDGLGDLRYEDERSCA